MKTKYLLSALALPALMAACVNDDFETQNQGSSMVENDLLKGRAVGELVLSADKYGVGNEADTRVNGIQGENGGINWFWQPDDKLGAVVVNYGGADRDEIVDGSTDYVITNFPFNANLTEQSQRATFSTPTAVVEGAYFFYNQYDREGVNRGKISHSLNQYIEVKSGMENTGLIQVGTGENDGQNFFISPITKVKVKDGEGEKLTAPISLQSIYSVLHMKFNLELSGEFAGRDVKIYKVELERSEKEGQDSKEFRNNFTLDPKALAKLQKEVKDENLNAPWASLLVEPSENQTDCAVIDATNPSANADNIREAMSAVMTKLQDPEELSDCFDEGESKLIYQLKEPYSFKANNNEQMQLMVLVPADVYELNDVAEKRDDAEKGVLKMTVYTSEGIYRSYVITEEKLEDWGETHQDEYVKGQYTFKRGGMATTTKTIRIGGDKSNITYYDFQNEGFPVATTEDWNYAIDYIKSHTGQFGGDQGGDTGNSWNFPKLNLSNYNGKPIEVDAEHYFPDMRIIYKGDAVLKLVGEDGSNYALNPRNMIFGEDNERPTILIEKQPNSTVTFDYTSEKPATIEDGKNYTKAWRLNSDAKIKVAEDQEVTFEMLKSHTALNIAKGGNVVVEDDATEPTLTEGTVTLAEGDKETTTKFTVKNEYTNNALLTINKYALATLDKEVSNNAVMDVIGNLDGNAKFTNAETGCLNVKAWSVSMNDKSRGIAILKEVENEGKIVLEKRQQGLSGTYGGDLTIEELFDNRGEMVVEGILTAGTEANGILWNTGVIYLGKDPYAQIIVKDSYSAAQNTGKIVLEAPDEYEFYDNYYLKGDGQELSTYEGVIEAILDNETYKKVMTNYGQYTAQERAWEVINKVIVTDKLELQVNNENAKKDFILDANASIDIVDDVTIASLAAVETGTAITTANNAVFNVNETVTVEAAADLTVAKGVTLMLQNVNNDASFNAPMLDIVGTLANNGKIDTKDGQDKANNIYTAIRQGGVLKNNGYLSKEAEFKYGEDNYNALATLIEGLWNSTNTNNPYSGTVVALGSPRVELVNDADLVQWTNETGLNKTNQANNYVTLDRLEDILSEGSLVTIEDYQAIKWAHPNVGGNWTYYMYLGYNKGEKITDEQFNEWKSIIDDAKTTITNEKLSANYTVNGTWFNAQNWGVLDLSSELGNAWGESENMIRTANKIGYFNNDPEYK